MPQRVEALSREADHTYTYADVLAWDKSVRAEIIDGELYMMAPPVRIHQRISVELCRQIANYLDGKPCEVYPAPFGVRLFPEEDKSDDTFVEPDIVVVCDSSKLDDWGCNGAPDLIIEILSPSNSRHDRFVKFQKYLSVGVREYWIVDPEDQTVQVHILDRDRYITAVYDETDTAPITVLPGCVINLAKVFSQ
ncbi:MAG: Uma2 family endonuclease [Treponema sp.]|jgi:Uma2 family endonuclease|nr:Uma2 family endonuclease [Treponema sp.]